jgi:lipopolysaccharide/colanic/teichoic acid biosynthesis glycosyltransferase/glycosyltransferase involved in cell wall biosynthesis
MISIVIPVKNGAETIEECLRAVLNQENDGIDYEVIVVDDGSTDQSGSIAEATGVQVIRQKNMGPAGARNNGAKRARGEIVAFTDADCVPSPDWLIQLIEPLKDKNIVGTKGVYITRQKSLIARFIQQEYESKYIHMRKQENIDFIDTYSAAYKKDIFLRNGGFEATLPVAEDQEFSFRLARKGYLMVFVPKAKVCHYHVDRLSEYFIRKYQIGYWKAFILRWLPEKALSDSHTLPSQRLQILLLGISILLALIGLYIHPGFYLAGLTLAIFFLSSLPLFIQIARRDPLVLIISPLMVLLRAIAQILGLANGTLFPPTHQHPEIIGLKLPARLIKRFFDIAGGLVGLLISLPLILLGSIAIIMEDGFPIFYIQERAGENGKPFPLVKLRTMYKGADQQVEKLLKLNPLKGPAFKIPNDPRVTKVGRLLRRWSIDELPQFWNVLLGDMSLVGPRPEETWVVAQYNDFQRQRLAVKPGMTGPMQIGGRGELDIENRLALELEYINHYSLLKDLQIILSTVPAIFRGDGAY